MQTLLNASVIISTYNQPKWLELVLHSYNVQTVRDFEIIIADDGSDDRTKSVIEAFMSKTELKVLHVWQKDEGFQKTKVLNKAITASTTAYLIFTDGDCIARNDFVQTHLRLQQQKCALSGGYFKLTKDVSKLITTDVIDSQKCFDRDWLLDKGQPKSFKFNKLTKSKVKAKMLNALTPTKATFDGMNVSCYKKDIKAVNGFDERMQYGGEDREVGERMMNNGITFIQVRYSTICLHLYHERPYKNEANTLLNKQLRKVTKKNKLTWTPFGMVKD